MTTRIKICGIKNGFDADVASRAGADAIGLVFYPKSPRAVSLKQACEILRTVAPLVTTVGLFVDPTADEVNRVLDHCELDCLQFHGSESAEFCVHFSRPYLRALSMKPAVDVAAIIEEHPRARAFLFDAWRADAPGGTGNTFPWERIPVMTRPWILAGGLTANNVARAMRECRPLAVDVSGGVEKSPGIKDKLKVQEFISAVRREDTRRQEDATV